jgi:NADH dehydrogenase [ubiquinone] 1 alpha subcomplex assembly factor 7
MTSADLPRRLAALIEAEGPITVERFMAESNQAYYAARDPLGAAGDFITAPEISQMFGELIGAWLADLWQRAGRPPAHYVELGPGRGTLAADALRAMRAAGFVPPVHFFETSPVLRGAQGQRVPTATWHDNLATLPADTPLLIVANEFLDALPIRQLIKTYSGWRERMVGHNPAGFFPMPGDEPRDAEVPPQFHQAPAGSILEISPAALMIVSELSRRIARQGGAALLIDYGYADRAPGDTLQAVHAHAYADPFAEPGASDLTAHVDFTAIAAAASGSIRIHGPTPQGQWLGLLGIAHRAAAIAHANPTARDSITAAHARLTGDEEMGSLFKVLALAAPDWPPPAGF